MSIYSYYGTNLFVFIDTTTDEKFAVLSAFSESSAEPYKRTQLASAEVVKIVTEPVDLPVVSFPVEVTPKVASTLAWTHDVAAAATSLWKGLSITKAVISSEFAGVIG
tara:strand:+ start:442 stop:765 length:324 start_codon:yes stop_codon:yes gene_type:complete